MIEKTGYDVETQKKAILDAIDALENQRLSIEKTASHSQSAQREIHSIQGRIDLLRQKANSLL